ncbi:hypothetical protein AB1N83_014188 [Pleurotus pulmonarius]
MDGEEAHASPRLVCDRDRLHGVDGGQQRTNERTKGHDVRSLMWAWARSGIWCTSESHERRQWGALEWQRRRAFLRRRRRIRLRVRMRARLARTRRRIVALREFAARFDAFSPGPVGSLCGGGEFSVMVSGVRACTQRLSRRRHSFATRDAPYTTSSAHDDGTGPWIMAWGMSTNQESR